MPFYHSVASTKAILSGDFAGAMPHIAVVPGYAAVIFALAILVFHRNMRINGAQ